MKVFNLHLLWMMAAKCAGCRGGGGGGGGGEQA